MKTHAYLTITVLGLAVSTTAYGQERRAGRLTVATTVLPPESTTLATTNNGPSAIAHPGGVLDVVDPNALLVPHAGVNSVRIIGSASSANAPLNVKSVVKVDGLHLGPLVPPPPAWASRHNMSASDYQEQVDALAAQGFRVVNVTVSGDIFDPRFTATFVQDGLPWAARHGLTADQYQQAVDTFAAQGLRVLCVSAYGSFPNELYAATWVNDGMPWIARHRQSATDYQNDYSVFPAQGFRPAWVSVIGQDDAATFASVWVADGNVFDAVHARTLEDLRTVIRDNSGNNLRLVSLSRYWGCNYGVDTLFAAIFVNDGRNFLEFDNQTSDEYQTTTDTLAPDGYRPEFAVDSGPLGCSTYTSSFVRDPGQLVFSMTGQDVPELAGIDKAIQQYMQQNNVSAGSVAVTKNGRLVLNRAYTWGPVSMQLTQPDCTFRLASVSKSLTSAAIYHLVAQGQLDINQPIVTRFPELLLGLLNGNLKDPRWLDVTFQNLLQHTGGWNRDLKGGFDPMFDDWNVCHFFNVPEPTNPALIMNFMEQAKPLDFTPGTDQHYSNFGYSILGRVIERVTGRNYEEYVKNEILARVGASNFHLSKSLYTNRDPSEVIFEHGAHNRDVMGTGRIVPVQYGGWNIESMDSHGGWAASTKDYARFLCSFDDTYTNPIMGNDQIQSMWTPPAINGTKLAAGWVNDGDIKWHNGVLDGTWTQFERHSDGTCWVAFFNRRHDGFPAPINTAINRVTSWPTNNLFQ
jgi:CubicO group peptidase (beta-lactamase class C family)